MWQWVSNQFNNSMRIGNVFLYDNFPKAAIVNILNALYPNNN